jgi:hypothetical protein
MANKKITELTAMTGGDVDGDELLAIVDTPSGTPATKKIAATDLFTTMMAGGLPAVVSNLTVSGSATISGTARFSTAVEVSATLSVGGIIRMGEHGHQIGYARLYNSSYTASGAAVFNISCSTSAYSVLDLHVRYQYSGGGIHVVALSTDAGVGYFLQTPNLYAATVSGGAGSYAWLNVRIHGNGAANGVKVVQNDGCYGATGAPGTAINVAMTSANGTTATANTGIINEIKIFTSAGGTTVSISNGWVTLYGYR